MVPPRLQAEVMKWHHSAHQGSLKPENELK